MSNDDEPMELSDLEEQELLDTVAPLRYLDPHYEQSPHSHIQGCASCGYDPDFCNCGEYDPPNHLR